MSAAHKVFLTPCFFKQVLATPCFVYVQVLFCWRLSPCSNLLRYLINTNKWPSWGKRRTCICLAVCLAVCLAACLAFCLAVRLAICLAVCLFVCLSHCLSCCLSCWLSVSLYALLSVSLSICLAVCLTVCTKNTHEHVQHIRNISATKQSWISPKTRKTSAR